MPVMAAGNNLNAKNFFEWRVDSGDRHPSYCLKGGHSGPMPPKENDMKVMVMVKATADSEAGAMPSTELLEAMGKFNEELVNAGVMLAGEGLKPSAQGARIAFDGPQRRLIDGPFAETRELVAGFWLWQVRSMDEAIEWAKRCPNPMPGSTRSSPRAAKG